MRTKITCLTRTFQRSQDDEFARSIRVRDAARRAFITVDTDQRLRKAAVSSYRPDRLTFEPRDMCYFWRDGVGWSPGMATVVSQVGQGHYFVDYGGRTFKQSAEQLSQVTERERLAQKDVRESQDHGRTVHHGSDEPELPQQPSQTSDKKQCCTCVTAGCLDAIKQRVSRNETRFQWVEGATMPADVLTKGKERRHVELLRMLLQTARYRIRVTFEMLEERRRARERKLLRHQERREASVE